MDCRTAQLLMPFARPPAELPAEERALVERHLAECPACRESAGREQQFDAAVARAMKLVDVPAGLRAQIGVRLAAQHGRTIQRRTWQVAALAACVLLALSFPLGWWSSRTDIDPNQLILFEEDQNNAVVVNPSRELAQAFLRARGVDVELPTDFDYRLLTHLDVVNFHGKHVAQLEFQNGPNRAKIYVLPRRDFRLAKNAESSAQGSHCTIEIVEWSKDYLFVIVYYGEANRQNFMPRGVVG